MHVVQCLLLAVVVLPPGEDGSKDDQEDDRRHRNETEPPAERVRAATEDGFEPAAARLSFSRWPPLAHRGSFARSSDSSNARTDSASSRFGATRTTCPTRAISNTLRAAEPGAASAAVPPRPSIALAA